MSVFCLTTSAKPNTINGRCVHPPCEVRSQSDSVSSVKSLHVAQVTGPENFREEFVMENWYVGLEDFEGNQGQTVFRRGRELSPGPSLKRVQYNEGWFAWGNDSSGVRQLAYALLLDTTKSTRSADRWHEEFAASVIAKLPKRWVLTESEIKEWWMNAPLNPMRESNGEEKTETNQPGSSRRDRPGRERGARGE